MFFSPLGLLALLGVPAVVGLYLFRRRTRARKVSAVFLWDAPELSPVAGRRVERLRNEPALWCELLLALLLGLLVAGPRGCGSRTATHLVCVLDGSASMSARDDEHSAAERARAWIDDELADLSARSLATLVVSGPNPTLLAGPAVSIAEARAALADYDPRHAGDDLGAALDLARELARDGRILIATDHFNTDLADERTHLVSFGRPSSNVGIVHALRERDHTSGGDVIWATVQNFSANAATRTLRVTGAGDAPLTQELTLAPLERRTIELPSEVSAASANALVDVSLDPDALTIDDNVRLSPPPRRTLRVHMGLRASLAIALGLDSTGERWAELVGDAVVAVTPTDAHLSLGPADGLGPNTWNWEFTENAETAWIGPFLFDRGHPLVEGVALEGTVWMGSKTNAPRGTPVISNGDRVLLAEEVRGNRRTLHANLDPHATNLTRSPDWPILLSNWSEARRAQLPGPVETNLVQGETLTWRGLASGTHTLVTPRGERRELEAGDRLVVDRLDEVGEYRLLDSEQQELGSFSVRFEDSTESNLLTRVAGERKTDRARAEVESRHDPLPTIMWTLVLGLLLLDFFVLRPRSKRETAR